MSYTSFKAGLKVIYLVLWGNLLLISTRLLSPVIMCKKSTMVCKCILKSQKITSLINLYKFRF